MSRLTWIRDTAGFAPNDRDGPLALMMLILTVVTGIVDAVSYLRLGHVFVANMTGNVAFLGFAVGGDSSFSIAASLLALGSFLLGAVAGGRLGHWTPYHRGRVLVIGASIEVTLVLASLGVVVMHPELDATVDRNALIVLLGLTMGLQNAVARRLGVADMSTTVLTSTLAGLAAESRLAGGAGTNSGRRMVATLAMLAGAAVGTWMIYLWEVGAALALAAALLAVIGFSIRDLWASAADWTRGGA